MKSYLSFIILTLLFSSCLGGINDENDNIPNFTPQTEEDIIKYIEDNNLNAQKSETGLYYVIENEGDGTRPNSNSNVTVAYKTYLLDETFLDQSGPNGISFNLQNVIKGWTEGITYFKEGGKGILIVPYELGYGPNQYGSIPGGSVLVFEIELIRVY